MGLKVHRIGSNNNGGNPTRLFSAPRLVGMPRMKEEFEKHLSDIGSHILYVRLMLNLKHNCWDEVKSQPEGLNVCPICYGTGYQISVERHLGRDWDESTPGRQTRSLESAEPGTIENPFHSIAFKGIVRPKAGDLVFRVEWNEQTQLPVSLLEAYMIQRAVDLRDEQGVLAYYKCYCLKASINASEVEKILRTESRIRIID